MMLGYAQSGTSNDFFCYDGSGNVWDTTANSGAGGFTTWIDANYQRYRVAATEMGTSGRFIATTPTGTILYELRIRGATLAASAVVWSDKVGAIGSDGGIIRTTNSLDGRGVKGNPVVMLQDSGGAFIGLTEIHDGAPLNFVSAAGDECGINAGSGDAGNFSGVFPAPVLANAPAGSGGGGDAPTVDEIWSYGERTLTEPNSSSVLSQQYANFDLIRGDSYGDNSRPLLIAWNGSSWPDDLSLYTWSLQSALAKSNTNSGDSITGTVGIVTATGDSRALKISIASDVTAAAAIGLHDYSVKGTLISDNTQKWGPVLGTFLVEDDYS